MVKFISMIQLLENQCFVIAGMVKSVNVKIIQASILQKHHNIKWMVKFCGIAK